MVNYTQTTLHYLIFFSSGKQFILFSVINHLTPHIHTRCVGEELVYYVIVNFTLFSVTEQVCDRPIRTSYRLQQKIHINSWTKQIVLFFVTKNLTQVGRELKNYNQLSLSFNHRE